MNNLPGVNWHRIRNKEQRAYAFELDLKRERRSLRKEHFPDEQQLEEEDV